MSRFISACFILGVLTIAAFAQTASTANPVEAQKPQAAKPRFKLTISRETTYLTEPLKKNGYIDYERALNEQKSKGVTPENNAAVLLWKAFGPQEIGQHLSQEFQKALREALRERFFKMLSIEPLPEKGDYIFPLTEYAGKIGGADVPKPGTPEQKEWEDELTERFKNLYLRPWARKEHPLIARWLDAHEKHIEILVEASKRPQMYSPIISSSEAGDGMLGAAFLPTLRPFLESAFMLSARAMLRLNEGKTEDAQQDILACHRLARLEGEASILIQVRVAIAIETIACQGDAMIAAHGNLTVKQAARFQADLRKLSSMPRLINIFNIAERYTYLDTATDIMHHGPEAWDVIFGSDNELENILGSKKQLNSTVTKLMTLGKIDWNEVLRTGNENFDKMVEAAGKKTRAERITAIKKFNEDLNKKTAKTRKTLGGPLGIAKSLFLSHKATGRLIGDFLFSELQSMSLFQGVIENEVRGTARLQLSKLAYALAGYRAEHNEYPKKLSQLSPEYIDRVPKDLFSASGFRYKREQYGYLLYSVGTNCKDDGGRTSDSKPPGDDLVIDTRPKVETKRDDL